MSVQATFPNEPVSVPAARRLVREALAGLPREVVERALIMVSELATNSLKHASSGFSVSVEVTDDVLRVEVADSGGGSPSVRHPRPTDPTGRGLQIVKALSTDWGVKTSRAGKVVWFVLPTAGTARPSRLA